MVYGNDKNNSGGDQFSFIKDSEYGGTRHFVLKGRIFANEAAYMERELDHALWLGCKRIVIDMSLVKVFTSGGIRVILATYKKIKATGGTLQIEAPSENVKNVIGMVALDELLLK